MRLFLLSFFIFGTITLFVACEKLEPKPPAEDSVMDAPLSGLSTAQNLVFLEGAEEFDEVYNSATGLGPIFVANSCGSCHGGDNRGHLFTALTRFGQSDTTGNTYTNAGGPQIQNFALAGHYGEQIPDGATSSVFLAPIVAGSGFLELVSDADLLALSDPNDANGDGISGVPSWRTLPDWVVTSPNAISQNEKFICRFGRKASAYNLHQQTVGAFNQDMGITTTFMPQNPMNVVEGIYPVATADPEVSDQSVNATVFYLQVLQTPLQRNQNDAIVKQGREIFDRIGCEKCHVANLQTGYSPVEALSLKTFHPFTDLLLHDMGSELDDHYTEGNALTSEWRTAPLWGLGLAGDAQGGDLFLLHDGRARSIEEAIRYHGGEGASSRQNFENLNATEQSALITFLQSL